MIDIYKIISKLFVLIGRDTNKIKLNINQKYPTKSQLLEYLEVKEDEWQYVVKLLRATKIFNISENDVITFDNWKEYDNLIDKVESPRNKLHIAVIQTKWIRDIIDKYPNKNMPLVAIYYYKSLMGFDKVPNWDSLFLKTSIYPVNSLIKKIGFEQVIKMIKWCTEKYSYKFNIKYIYSYYTNYIQNSNGLETTQNAKQDEALAQYK